jgi:hypothetical protein
MRLKYIPLGATLMVGAARSAPRPAVIELFTSEGCSSCPPAEAFFAELAQRSDVHVALIVQAAGQGAILGAASIAMH